MSPSQSKITHCHSNIVLRTWLKSVPGAQQIAELLAEYAVATGAGPISTRTRNRLEELPVNVPHVHQAVRQFENADEEWDLGEGEENVADDDALTVTDTTASTIDESEQHRMGPPKLTKAEMRAIKKASKAAKSQSKAAKNQKKHTISVRAEDVSFVAKILHGEPADVDGATHPLATDKTIEEVIARNMGFLSSNEEHKKMLLSSISQRRKSEQNRRRSATAFSIGGPKKRRFSERGHDNDNHDDDDMEDLVVAALTNLGIDPDHARSGGPTAAVSASNGANAKKNGNGANKPTGCITSIITALKALVRDDLERFENEQRETYIRAGGFWRYVGRPVFERMTEIARELDWKTGMRFKEANNNVEREE